MEFFIERNISSFLRSRVSIFLLSILVVVLEFLEGELGLES